MTYDDFIRGTTNGTVRFIPNMNGEYADPNGGGYWAQIAQNPMDPNGDPIWQAMPGFVPPSAPAPVQFDNLGAGFSTPLTSGGQQVYTTLYDSGPESGRSPVETYYLANDPNRPANAQAAMAGGYSSGNDSFLGGLGDVLKTAALGSAGFGVGGLSGASAATGNGVTPQTLALDAAGLAGGYGLAGALGGAAPAAGAAGVTGLPTAAAPGVAGAVEGFPAVAGADIGAFLPGAAGATVPAGAAGAADVGAFLPGGAGAAGAAAAPSAVTGGTAGVGTGAAAAGAAGVGGTKLGDILSGKVSAGDLASNMTLGDAGRIFGTGAATLGSIYGNQQIADQYQQLANQYMNLGAPSRARYEASFQPGFDITQDPALKSALDASSQAILRGLSTSGNPYGNPGALAEANKYITSNVALPYLQNYRNQNAATGGYNAFSTAAPSAAANSINASGNTYADIGRGIANIFNPPTSLEQLLKQMSGSSQRTGLV